MNEFSSLVGSIRAVLTLPEGYVTFVHSVRLRMEVLSWALFGRLLHQRMIWSQDKHLAQMVKSGTSEVFAIVVVMRNSLKHYYTCIEHAHDALTSPKVYAAHINLQELCQRLETASKRGPMSLHDREKSVEVLRMYVALEEWVLLKTSKKL
ncbi:hypothetical protein AEP_01694 [Curvibacter sp. AEP1-3]|uniref:hypothetical protein n=1 Tax=Curvibacter sp. AEP1-3 TaxID=1844971 RepID=UPI000B3D4C24|nr:hypothetical protein [Curvibacter sp. AEP1-3]ARV18638.1 hypothetical protein AEP_01694 [Curvibacter sp. AEP1-3]